MSEPRDPLRSLFREAGDFGQARSDADPASSITQRGMRAQRRRMAVVAVGVCLVVGAGGAVAVGLLPVRPEPVVPATTPSPSYPSPVPSDRLSTGAPSLPPTPGTTLPGGAETRGTQGSVVRSAPPGGAPTGTRTGMSRPTTSTTLSAPTSTPSATTDGAPSMH
jgi:hypothetical protein